MSATLLIGTAGLMVLAALLWCGVRSWLDAGIVAVGGIALFGPLLRVTGDISRYVPAGWFSDGPQGKDEIVVASVVSSFLVPLILAAVLLCVWKRTRGA